MRNGMGQDEGRRLGDDLRQALGEPDAHFTQALQAALTGLAEQAAPERLPRVGRLRGRRALLGLAVLLVALVGTAAAAGAVLPGLLALTGLEDDPVAAAMVQPVGQLWASEYAVAEVQELLYDGYGALLTVHVRPADSGQVLLLPSGAGGLRAAARSLPGVTGTEAGPGETIAAYADRLGLSVVVFGCGVQNEASTFVTAGLPDDLHRAEDGSWTQVLRIPAAESSEQLRVRFHSTLYDRPAEQARLSIGDPGRPVSEVSSLLIPVSPLRAGDAAPTVLEAAEVEVTGALPGLNLVQARLVETWLDTYIDLSFDTPQDEFIAAAVVMVESEAGERPEMAFASPVSLRQGYKSGLHYAASLGASCEGRSFCVRVQLEGEQQEPLGEMQLQLRFPAP